MFLRCLRGTKQFIRIVTMCIFKREKQLLLIFTVIIVYFVYIFDFHTYLLLFFVFCYFEGLVDWWVLVVGWLAGWLDRCWSACKEKVPPSQRRNQGLRPEHRLFWFQSSSCVCYGFFRNQAANTE